jgi:hypothetical protein
MNETIENLHAIAFPMGFDKSGAAVALPNLVLLHWNSTDNEKLVQVYVNGRLVDATRDPLQRAMLIEIEPDLTSAIEVIPVTPDEAWVDFSGQLTGFSADDGSRVTLCWPRSGYLPLSSLVTIYGDNGSGVIDDQTPLAIISVWPRQSGKWGWGLDGFGEGGFGFSGSAAPGWEQGSFGIGAFGFDVEMQCWKSPPLVLGAYQFEIRTDDDETGSLFQAFIDPLPAARALTLADYDAANGKLTLEIG